MTKDNQLAFILNPKLHPIELADALYERLSKANSLAQFALTESISDHLNENVHNYLWALSQIIHEAYEIHQKLGHCPWTLSKE